jgi:hypothetical protein
MIPGQIVFPGEKARSAWFPRQADNARFSFQKISDGGSNQGALTIRVLHKNAEDAGDGSTITATSFLLEAGTSFPNGTVSTELFQGLKELVRFEYEANVAGTVWIEFQQLDPAWFNTPTA